MRYTYKVDHPSIPGGSVTETVEAANDTAAGNLIRARYPGASFTLESRRSRRDTLRGHYEKAIRCRSSSAELIGGSSSKDRVSIASEITIHHLVSDIMLFFLLPLIVSLLYIFFK